MSIVGDINQNYMKNEEFLGKAHLRNQFPLKWTYIDDDSIENSMKDKLLLFWYVFKQSSLLRLECMQLVTVLNIGRKTNSSLEKFFQKFEAILNWLHPLRESIRD